MTTIATILLIIVIWFAVSIPVGIVLGRILRKRSEGR
jgi:hypothetical protein